MNQETTLSTELALNPNDPGERQIMIAERQFALSQRRAKLLASSDIVPQQFKDSVPNCVIAQEMAHRMGVGELEIMQSLYIVHGRPSFSSQYIIARVNSCGVIQGRLSFEMQGEEGTDDWGCRAVGICAQTGERLVGTLITIKMAKEEGWHNKSGSKWKTMPEQMLRYRAAGFWSRVNAPEAIMGMRTTEEEQDRGEIEINPAGAQPAASADINAMVAEQGAKTTAAAPQGEQGPVTIDQDPAEVGTGDGTADPGLDAKPINEMVSAPPEDSEVDNRTWPRHDEGFWHDSAGTVYDETKHGWSGQNQCPAVNQDGTFRAKRGTGVDKGDPRAQQTAEQQNGDPGPSEAYGLITTAIDICKTPDDFLQLDAMECWSQLADGEAMQLRQLIEARKNELRNTPAQ